MGEIVTALHCLIRFGKQKSIVYKVSEHLKKMEHDEKVYKM